MRVCACVYVREVRSKGVWGKRTGVVRRGVLGRPGMSRRDEFGPSLGRVSLRYPMKSNWIDPIGFRDRVGERTEQKKDHELLDYPDNMP